MLKMRCSFRLGLFGEKFPETVFLFFALMHVVQETNTGCDIVGITQEHCCGNSGHAVKTCGPFGRALVAGKCCGG